MPHFKAGDVFRGLALDRFLAAGAHGEVDDLASELGVSYRTAQNRKAEALATLRGHLVALGVERAPRLRAGEAAEGPLGRPDDPPPGAGDGGKVVPFAPRAARGRGQGAG